MFPLLNAWQLYYCIHVGKCMIFLFACERIKLNSDISFEIRSTIECRCCCNGEMILCIHCGIYHEFGLLCVYREIMDKVRILSYIYLYYLSRNFRLFSFIGDVGFSCLSPTSQLYVTSVSCACLQPACDMWRQFTALVPNQSITCDVSFSNLSTINQLYVTSISCACLQPVCDIWRQFLMTEWCIK